MAKSIYYIGSLHKNQKQYIIAEKSNNSDVPAKRVDLVTIKMIKESSVLYSGRRISSPSDAVDLAKAFIDGSDREQFVVCTIDTKNQPTSISVVSIGSLNYTVVHPREVFKTAIMSNSSAIISYSTTIRLAVLSRATKTWKLQGGSSRQGISSVLR